MTDIVLSFEFVFIKGKLLTGLVLTSLLWSLGELSLQLSLRHKSIVSLIVVLSKGCPLVVFALIFVKLVKVRLVHVLVGVVLLAQVLLHPM